MPLLQNGISSKSWLHFYQPCTHSLFRWGVLKEQTCLKSLFCISPLQASKTLEYKIKFTLILLQRYPGRELRSYYTFVEKEKKTHVPSNSNLETTEVFQYDIRERSSQKWRYSFPGRAALAPQDHGLAVRTATCLEFLVSTFNTKKYSHFPWFFK